MRLQGAGWVSDGQGNTATEEPSIRQSGDSDPGCHQDSIAAAAQWVMECVEDRGMT